MGEQGMKFLQPCLTCGKLSRGNRCPEHQAAVDAKWEAMRAARKKQTRQYSGDYARRAKEVRESATHCHLCQQPFTPYDIRHADHLIPGDPNSPLAAAHKRCNEARGNKPLKEN